jgi:hypothetical protein
VVVQLSTTLLLGLAANTSFGGLPVLAAKVAADDRKAAADLWRRWEEWQPDIALVMVTGVDEKGRPSRLLGPAVAHYLRQLAVPGTGRVLLLIGEVAPDRWWEQVLFNRRGAVVARYVGRNTDALVCRLRFRLLPRRVGAGRPGTRRELVLPRANPSA